MWESLPDKFSSRGIMVCIDGWDGQGKSSLAMTLAELCKVGYIDLDQSVDRAMKPADRTRVRVHPVRYEAAHTEEAIKKVCGDAWLKLEKSVEDSAWAGGIVIDTEGELWELRRLASFGTLSPKARRMDRLYGPVNALYRKFLRDIYRHRRQHLVLVRQLKDEYIEKFDTEAGGKISIRTGEAEPKGWGEVDYLADIIVRVGQRDDNRFSVTIHNCKLPPNGPSLRGLELDPDQFSFASIVSLATDTDPEDWIR